MRDILLDTNFLVAPFQIKVSIFEEIDQKYPGNRVFTLDLVVEESKSIEDGKYGNLVEKLIESENIEVLETEGNGFVDDLLVDLSEEFLIATNDKELKNRILENGNPVMYIRSSSHLVVENEEM